MKVLMINQPLNNRGDESAHKALIRKMLSDISNVNITVLFIGVNQDSVEQFAVKDTRVKYINLTPKRGFWRMMLFLLQRNRLSLAKFVPMFKKVENYYKTNDIILSAPGGICMGGFQSWPHLFFLKMAKYANKPLFYYGRSFGPFPIETKLNRRFKNTSMEMLRYFSFFSIRDRKSELLAQDLGIRYVPTVDSAFLDLPETEIPIQVKELIGNEKYMVFVPNLLIWHYAYKNRVSKETIVQFYIYLLDYILQHFPGHKIVMLPQTFNYGSQEGDDIHFFRDLERLKCDSRIVVVQDCYSSDIQQCIIRKAHFLIGARYHSVVFAINNNIPFIALSYEHKIVGLLQSLGKKEYMVDITEAFDSSARMEQALDSIKNKLNDLSSDIKACNQARQIANECFSKFTSCLIAFDK